MTKHHKKRKKKEKDKDSGMLLLLLGLGASAGIGLALMGKSVKAEPTPAECDDANPCQAGEECVAGECQPISECVSNQTESQNVNCGLNNNGTQTQERERICTDGQWSGYTQWQNVGACADPDQCRDGTTQNQACGLNNNGTQTRTCVAGQYGNWSACNDPDECINGRENTQNCPDGSTIVVERCVGGNWVDTGEECPVPVVCNELIDYPNRRAVQLSMNECWEYTFPWSNSCCGGPALQFNNCVWLERRPEGTTDSCIGWQKDDNSLTFSFNIRQSGVVGFGPSSGEVNLKSLSHDIRDNNDFIFNLNTEISNADLADGSMFEMYLYDESGTKLILFYLSNILIEVNPGEYSQAICDPHHPSPGGCLIEGSSVISGLVRIRHGLGVVDAFNRPAVIVDIEGWGQYVTTIAGLNQNQKWRLGFRAYVTVRGPGGQGVVCTISNLNLV